MAYSSDANQRQNIDDNPLLSERPNIESSASTGRFSPNAGTVDLSLAADDDEIQSSLKPRSRYDKGIQSFLHNYAQCKDRPVGKLFESMVAYSISEPPNFSRQPIDTVSMIGSGDPERSSFSQMLSGFRVALRKGKSGCVRFCVVSFDASDDMQSKAFPLRKKIFTTVRGLRRKFKAPRSAILHIINQEWHLPLVAMRDCNVDLTTARPGPFIEQSSQLTTVSLDSMEGLSFELEWLSLAPEYLGTISTYIWQPQVEPPKTIKIRMIIRYNAVGERRDVVAILSGWDMSKSLLSNSDKLRRRSLITKLGKSTSSARSEIYKSIYTAYIQLIEDTFCFVDSANVQTTRLTSIGRKSPSSEQFQFLLHLDDCCDKSASGLLHAFKVLERISGLAKMDNIDESLKQWPDIKLTELLFLKDKVMDIKQQGAGLKEMIKDQIGLRSSRNTGLLGLLATIYVPFAFLSSLFGMNINEPLWGPVIPSSMTQIDQPNSSDTGLNSTSFTDNQTEAIVSAISSSSSTYLWSFKMYWLIAAPVALATVLLPLIAGSTLRYMSKIIYDNRAYSRLLLTILALMVIVTIDQFVPVEQYLFIFGISYGLIALTMLMWSSHSGRNQWIWAGFSVTFAAAVAMDELVDAFDNVGITGYLPLGYLILLWFRSELRDFLVPKLRWLDRHSGIISWAKRTSKTQTKVCQAGVICVYYVVTLFIYFVVPYPGTLCIFSIPLGVLAINRVLSSFSTKTNRLYWSAYTFFFAVSLGLDAIATLTFDCFWDSGAGEEVDGYCVSGNPGFGYTCFISANYLMIGWLYALYKPGILKVWARLLQILNRPMRQATLEMEQGVSGTTTSVPLQQINPERGAAQAEESHSQTESH